MTLRDEDRWNPGLEGTVLCREATKMGEPYVGVHVSGAGPRVGDKLGASHGIKMTVGKIVPLEKMPSVVDEVTGMAFKSNIISTKNMRRGISGLIREMSATMSRYTSISGFRGLEAPSGLGIYTWDSRRR